MPEVIEDWNFEIEAACGQLRLTTEQELRA